MLRSSYQLPFLLRWGMVAAICCLAHVLPAQSGWVKEKGEIFAKLSLGGFASSHYYNLNGALLQTSQFRQAYLGLYGEYGWKDRITLMANWPAFKLQGFETTQTVGGIGDLMLGLKFALLQGGLPVSLTIMPEIPTGPANLLAQNKMIAFEQINLPTGDGEFNLHNTLAVSHSFYPVPVYVNLFADYNLRTGFEGNSFNDQGTAGLEAGWQFHPAFWLRGRLQAQKTLGDTPRLTDFVRGEGTAFTAYSLGLYYKCNDNWGLDVSYQGFGDFLVARRNLYSAPVWGIGLVFERK